jgi:hypothetical protein
MTAAPSLALVPADEPIPHPVQPYVEANPGSVLLYPKVREAFLAEIKAEIEAFVPDLSTRTSRAEIASLAYKVAKTKAPIEAAAKALTEDFRKRTAAVNAERNDVTAKLDGLRDLARAPLDAWEEAEKAREAKLKATFDAIDAATRVLASDTSETVKARIVQIEDIEDNEDFHDARERALDTLTAAYERLVKDEADRAELASLRTESEERKRQEDAQARAEAEKAAAAEKSERRRIEGHERAIESLRSMINDACSPFNGSDLIRHILELLDTMQEHKRDWQEFRELYDQMLAAGRTRIAARLADVVESEELRRDEVAKRAAEEAIAAERRRADAAAAEAKRLADAEIAKLAAEKHEMERAESVRVAEAKRVAEEELARQKDRKHRADVMTAAKEAIMRAACIDEPIAANIIKAIAAGKIANVFIKF